MTIIRNLDNPIIILDNPNISWAAKGLYCFLAFNPYSYDWKKVNEKEIQSLINELKENGYEVIDE